LAVRGATSRLTMKRRTTLTADSSDLETLKAEAARRGVSLARLLHEMVAREAQRIRADRPRPRVGVVEVGGDTSRMSWEHEDAPYESR
jgi:hypothetical protein